jgi:transcriptional regulator with XRE-family HTH domain
VIQAPFAELVQMTHKQWRSTFMRAWREHRGFTLEEIAQDIGIKHGQLSKIERGQQPYSQRILEAYARRCQCTVADLLIRPPTADEDLYVLLSGLDEEQKPYAAAMLRGLSATPKRPQ